MSKVDLYRDLARRENTTKSYAASCTHFEVEWGGFLPASSESVAKYLADIAFSHSTATLRARLAGLARWHLERGFMDPTKAPLVQEVMSGIRRAHTLPQRQAKPIQLEHIELVIEWIDRRLLSVNQSDLGSRLRLLRDRSMLLLGFWRGFRSDELTRLLIGHIEVTPGRGMTCFLPSSKSDRQSLERTYQTPALSRLCPVEAYQAWINAAGISTGPVYRKIDRWGHLNNDGMASDSIARWLRGLLNDAGVPAANGFSSHSLRRGFASWARSSGWDLKDLMSFVGWRDVQSAMRYLDPSSEDFQTKIEIGLERMPKSGQPVAVPASPESVASSISNVVPINGTR